MTETIDYAAVLARKLAAMFPDPSQREMVAGELARYGTEAYEREAGRVRVAILKVAGASLEKVREWVAIAKRDYRDVLAAAEYPRELVTQTWRLPEAECRAIREEDARQYRQWIETG